MDPLGNGLLGQSIYISPWGGGSTTTTITDAYGGYTLLQSPRVTDRIELYKSGNSSSLNAPYFYNISNNSQPFVIEQSTSLDITLPIKKVSVHVQDPAGNPVANAKVVSNDIANGYLSLAGLQAYGRSYETNRYSDANGNVDIWLFPTYGSGAYSLTVFPPTGSPLAVTTLSGFSFTTDTTVAITILQAVTLSGKVLDPLGNGLPGQSIYISSLGRWFNYYYYH